MKKRHVKALVKTFIVQIFIKLIDAIVFMPTIFFLLNFLYYFKSSEIMENNKEHGGLILSD